MLNAASLLLALFGGALNVIFVLFMALYITVDGPAMRDYLVVFAPRSRQAQARRVITNMASRLGHWVAGELVLCLIVGLGAGIGFGLIGVPGASLLALVWAIAELIPGIGPFISAVPSILLGFLAGPEIGVLATIFTLAWSQVENNVLVPRVMGHAVKLNPLVVLVALLIGNQLLGLAGALFAIPAAAALAVIVDELHRERLEQPEPDADRERRTMRSSRPRSVREPAPVLEVEFLTELGHALSVAGDPVSSTEGTLRQVAAGLGLSDVVVGALPTLVMVRSHDGGTDRHRPGGRGARRRPAARSGGGGLRHREARAGGQAHA